MNEEFKEILKGLHRVICEKEELEDRINKAIGFIQKYKFKGTEILKERYLDNTLSEELIEILKGEQSGK